MSATSAGSGAGNASGMGETGGTTSDRAPALSASTAVTARAGGPAAVGAGRLRPRDVGLRRERRLVVFLGVVLGLIAWLHGSSDRARPGPACDHSRLPRAGGCGRPVGGMPQGRS